MSWKHLNYTKHFAKGLFLSLFTIFIKCIQSIQGILDISINHTPFLLFLSIWHMFSDIPDIFRKEDFISVTVHKCILN